MQDLELLHICPRTSNNSYIPSEQVLRSGKKSELTACIQEKHSMKSFGNHKRDLTRITTGSKGNFHDHERETTSSQWLSERTSRYTGVERRIDGLRTKEAHPGFLGMVNSKCAVRKTGGILSLVDIAINFQLLLRIWSRSNLWLIQSHKTSFIACLDEYTFILTSLCSLRNYPTTSNLAH